MGRTLTQRDLFKCSIRSKDDTIRSKVINTCCSVLGVDTTQIDSILNAYVTQISSNKATNTLSVGRFTLPFFHKVPKKASSRPFAQTNTSMRVLEQIAGCVASNEACLLVGETGTGKTTSVQELARMLGIETQGAQKASHVLSIENANSKQEHKTHLLVHNLSIQSEASDLLGGFRPQPISAVIAPFFSRFLQLFSQVLSLKANQKFLQSIQSAFETKNWVDTLRLMRGGCQVAMKRLQTIIDDHSEKKMKMVHDPTDQMKSWKKLQTKLQHLSQQFTDQFAHKSQDGEQTDQTPQADQPGLAFGFSFIDGVLVKALQEGHWLLLDEINMASPECLQCLNSVAESDEGSVWVRERAADDDEDEPSDVLLLPIKRHPNFRLFGCMNPPGDAGKRQLPHLLRSRFTEIRVNEITDIKELMAICEGYLSSAQNQMSSQELQRLSLNISKLYLSLREKARTGELTDSDGKRPLYSLRTLCRALQHVRRVLGMDGENTTLIVQSRPVYSMGRALFDGFMMCFVSSLSLSAQEKAEHEILLHLLETFHSKTVQEDTLRKQLKGQMNSVVVSIPATIIVKPVPSNQDIPKREEQNFNKYVELEHFFIPTGNQIPIRDVGYQETDSVQKHIREIARSAAGCRFPVLLEGPTSAGKTAIVEYMAALTGHKFVRINNHEQTDIQEYLGSYASDAGDDSLLPAFDDDDDDLSLQPENTSNNTEQDQLGPSRRNTGSFSLSFHEGPLVRAVREGWWIVLDELNLAPSDVLESLNRLLDDNREIFIPDTGELIKAHPHFMLFATQNPAGGQYGGRKMLSRALRNRFVEIRFDSLPNNELSSIINLRTGLAPRTCDSLIPIMRELETMRSASNLFAGRAGLITLRDLFRWGHRFTRFHPDHTDFDPKLHLAREGCYLLAERIRIGEEAQQVRTTIFTLLKVLLAPREDTNDPKKRQYGIEDGQVHMLYEVTGGWAQYSQPNPSKRHEWMEQREITSGLIRNQSPCFQTTQSTNLFVESDTLYSLGDSLQVITPPQNLPEVWSTLSSNLTQFLFQLFPSLKQLLDRDVELHDLPPTLQRYRSIAWTPSFARLFVLASRCFAASEPCLIIGDTGCGKTTVVELIAALNAQNLNTINCHQSTESGDLLGSLRPNRQTAASDEKLRLRLVSYFKKFSPDQNLQALTLGQLISKFQGHYQTLESASSVDEESAQMDVRIRRQTTLFLWEDGPLVSSMKRGDILLIDELALADDAVLERLNSVLEPTRTLWLSEKGGDDIEAIKAVDSFRLFATMNPGGDFGKRELSPALRSRFTEIWAPVTTNNQETQAIVQKQIPPSIDPFVGNLISTFFFTFPSICVACCPQLSENSVRSRLAVTIRDLLASASFVTTTTPQLGEISAFVHSLFLILLDGLAIKTGWNPDDCLRIRDKACESILLTLFKGMSHQLIRLSNQTPTTHLARAHNSSYPPSIQRLVTIAESETTYETYHSLLMDIVSDRVSLQDLIMFNHVMDGQQLTPVNSTQNNELVDLKPKVGTQPFYITPGPIPLTPSSLTYFNYEMELSENKATFSFESPTTSLNLERLLRALQLPRPILLEGAPGVGKTSLVSALAKACGYSLTRINLSEQSEIADLFGADSPTETAGVFCWTDGPFLQAAKKGEWVLLDELNLAPQQVLEGLNSCLDHRRSLTIPELSLDLPLPPSFTVFAAQNPHSQGGARKGLPKSFLNRFTPVYVEQMTENDLTFITSSLFPAIPQNVVKSMAHFTTQVEHATKGRLPLHNLNPFEDGVIERPLNTLGTNGAPWEFNLRDLMRWSEMLLGYCSPGSQHLSVPTVTVAASVSMQHIFLQRFRSMADRHCLIGLFEQIMGFVLHVDYRPQLIVDDDQVMAGFDSLEVRPFINAEEASDHSRFSQNLLSSLSLPLSSLIRAVNEKSMALLTGPTGSGKTTLIRFLAGHTHNSLEEVSLSPSADVSTLIGGYEQTDIMRHISTASEHLSAFVSWLTQFGIILKTHQTVTTDLTSTLSSLLKISSSLETIFTELKQQAENNTTFGLKLNSPFTQFWIHYAKLRLHYAYLSGDSKKLAAFIQCEPVLFYFRKSCTVLISIYEKTAPNSPMPSTAGMFEWVDGILIKALVDGKWLVFDNVNLCSPTVLDRMNPLLERDSNGIMEITEQGIGSFESHTENDWDQSSSVGIRRIKANHRFRLFFTMDPRNGEISRAMRNRGTEIALLPFSEADRMYRLETERYQPHTAIELTDAQRILTHLCFNMASLQTSAQDSTKETNAFSSFLRHPIFGQTPSNPRIVERYPIPLHAVTSNYSQLSDSISILNKNGISGIDIPFRMAALILIVSSRVNHPQSRCSIRIPSFSPKILLTWIQRLRVLSQNATEHFIQLLEASLLQSLFPFDHTQSRSFETVPGSKIVQCDGQHNEPCECSLFHTIVQAFADLATESSTPCSSDDALRSWTRDRFVLYDSPSTLRLIDNGDVSLIFRTQTSTALSLQVPNGVTENIIRSLSPLINVLGKEISSSFSATHVNLTNLVSSVLKNQKVASLPQLSSAFSHLSAQYLSQDLRNPVLCISSFFNVLASRDRIIVPLFQQFLTARQSTMTESLNFKTFDSYPLVPLNVPSRLLSDHLRSSRQNSVSTMHLHRVSILTSAFVDVYSFLFLARFLQIYHIPQTDAQSLTPLQCAFLLSTQTEKGKNALVNKNTRLKQQHSHTKSTSAQHFLQFEDNASALFDIETFDSVLSMVATNGTQTLNVKQEIYDDEDCKRIKIEDTNEPIAASLPIGITELERSSHPAFCLIYPYITRISLFTTLVSIQMISNTTLSDSSAEIIQRFLVLLSQVKQLWLILLTPSRDPQRLDRDDFFLLVESIGRSLKNLSHQSDSLFEVPPSLHHCESVLLNALTVSTRRKRGVSSPSLLTHFQKSYVWKHLIRLQRNISDEDSQLSSNVEFSSDLVPYVETLEHHALLSNRYRSTIQPKVWHKQFSRAVFEQRTLFLSKELSLSQESNLLRSFSLVYQLISQFIHPFIVSQDPSDLPHSFTSTVQHNRASNIVILQQRFLQMMGRVVTFQDENEKEETQVSGSEMIIMSDRSGEERAKTLAESLSPTVATTFLESNEALSFLSEVFFAAESHSVSTSVSYLSSLLLPILIPSSLLQMFTQIKASLLCPHLSHQYMDSKLFEEQFLDVVKIIQSFLQQYMHKFIESPKPRPTQPESHLSLDENVVNLRTHESECLFDHPSLIAQSLGLHMSSISTPCTIRYIPASVSFGTLLLKASHELATIVVEQQLVSLLPILHTVTSLTLFLSSLSLIQDTLENDRLAEYRAFAQPLLRTALTQSSSLLSVLLPSSQTSRSTCSTSWIMYSLRSSVSAQTPPIHLDSTSLSQCDIVTLIQLYVWALQSELSNELTVTTESNCSLLFRLSVQITSSIKSQIKSRNVEQRMDSALSSICLLLKEAPISDLRVRVVHTGRILSLLWAYQALSAKPTGSQMFVDSVLQFVAILSVLTPSFPKDLSRPVNQQAFLKTLLDLVQLCCFPSKIAQDQSTEDLNSLFRLDSMLLHSREHRLGAKMTTGSSLKESLINPILTSIRIGYHLQNSPTKNNLLLVQLSALLTVYSSSLLLHLVLPTHPIDPLVQLNFKQQFAQNELKQIQVDELTEKAVHFYQSDWGYNDSFSVTLDSNNTSYLPEDVIEMNTLTTNHSHAWKTELMEKWTHQSQNSRLIQVHPQQGWIIRPDEDTLSQQEKHFTFSTAILSLLSNNQSEFSQLHTHQLTHFEDLFALISEWTASSFSIKSVESLIKLNINSSSSFAQTDQFAQADLIDPITPGLRGDLDDSINNIERFQQLLITQENMASFSDLIPFISEILSTVQQTLHSLVTSTEQSIIQLPSFPLTKTVIESSNTNSSLSARLQYFSVILRLHSQLQSTSSSKSSSLLSPLLTGLPEVHEKITPFVEAYYEEMKERQAHQIESEALLVFEGGGMIKDTRSAVQSVRADGSMSVSSKLIMEQGVGYDQHTAQSNKERRDERESMFTDYVSMYERQFAKDALPIDTIQGDMQDDLLSSDEEIRIFSETPAVVRGYLLLFGDSSEKEYEGFLEGVRNQSKDHNNQISKTINTNLFELISATPLQSLKSFHPLSNVLSVLSAVPSYSPSVDRHSLPLYFNFHTDPLPSESTMSSLVLQPLQTRLQQLHRFHPNNDELLIMSSLTDHLLSLPHTTPFARLVGGFDVLIRKVDGWNKTHSRGITAGMMKEEENMLVLLEKWRQLEAQSWRSRVRLIEREYCMERPASRIFFQLYSYIFEEGPLGDITIHKAQKSDDTFSILSTDGEFSYSLSIREKPEVVDVLKTIDRKDDFNIGQFQSKSRRKELKRLNKSKKQKKKNQADNTPAVEELVYTEDDPEYFAHLQAVSPPQCLRWLMSFSTMLDMMFQEATLADFAFRLNVTKAICADLEHRIALLRRLFEVVQPTKPLHSVIYSLIVFGSELVGIISHVYANYARFLPLRDLVLSKKAEVIRDTIKQSSQQFSIRNLEALSASTLRFREQRNKSYQNYITLLKESTMKNEVYDIMERRWKPSSITDMKSGYELSDVEVSEMNGFITKSSKPPQFSINTQNFIVSSDHVLDVTTSQIQRMFVTVTKTLYTSPPNKTTIPLFEILQQESHSMLLQAASLVEQSISATHTATKLNQEWTTHLEDAVQDADLTGVARKKAMREAAKEIVNKAGFARRNQTLLFKLLDDYLKHGGVAQWDDGTTDLLFLSPFFSGYMLPLECGLEQASSPENNVVLSRLPINHSDTQYPELKRTTLGDLLRSSSVWHRTLHATAITIASSSNQQNRNDGPFHSLQPISSSLDKNLLVKIQGIHSTLVKTDRQTASLLTPIEDLVDSSESLFHRVSFRIHSVRHLPHSTHQVQAQMTPDQKNNSIGRMQTLWKWICEERVALAHILEYVIPLVEKISLISQTHTQQRHPNQTNIEIELFRQILPQFWTECNLIAQVIHRTNATFQPLHPVQTQIVQDSTLALFSPYQTFLTEDVKADKEVEDIHHLLASILPTITMIVESLTQVEDLLTPTVRSKITLLQSIKFSQTVETVKQALRSYQDILRQSIAVTPSAPAASEDGQHFFKLITQNLITICSGFERPSRDESSSNAEEDDFVEEPSKHLQRTHQLVVKLAKLLLMPQKLGTSSQPLGLHAIISSLVGDCTNLVQATVVVMKQFQLTLLSVLTHVMKWHRSLCLFTQIYSSQILHLLQYGFTVPSEDIKIQAPNDGDTADAGGQGGQDSGGTDGPSSESIGFGEGQGENDVSKDVENEKELLGEERQIGDNNPLNDDTSASKDDKTQSKEDLTEGFDVDMDFGGEMADVPEEETESKNKGEKQEGMTGEAVDDEVNHTLDEDEKRKQENEQENEIDQKQGDDFDFDPDNVLDEQLWNENEDNQPKETQKPVESSSELKGDDENDDDQQPKEGDTFEDKRKPRKDESSDKQSNHLKNTEDQEQSEEPINPSEMAHDDQSEPTKGDDQTVEPEALPEMRDLIDQVSDGAEAEGESDNEEEFDATAGQEEKGENKDIFLPGIENQDGELPDLDQWKFDEEEKGDSEGDDADDEGGNSEADDENLDEQMEKDNEERLNNADALQDLKEVGDEVLEKADEELEKVNQAEDEDSSHDIGRDKKQDKSEGQSKGADFGGDDGKEDGSSGGMQQEQDEENGLKDEEDQHPESNSGKTQNAVDESGTGHDQENDGAAQRPMTEDEASQLESATDELNPFKKMGDASKQWKQKLTLINHQEEQWKAQNQTIQQTPDKAVYEYQLDNEADEQRGSGESESSFEQALGSATEEQIKQNKEAIAQKIDTQDDIDEELGEVGDEDNVQPESEMLRDEDNPNQDQDNRENPQKKDVTEQTSDDPDKQFQDTTENEEIQSQNLEKEAQLKKSSDEKHKKIINFNNDTEKAEPVQPAALDAVSEEPSFEGTREDLLDLKKPIPIISIDDEDEDEEIIDLTNESAFQLKNAEEWNSIYADTTELSAELCEQLRLILTPNTATRARGEYKTGRRLNMRRVIPYIASHFRKDRIWMRRATPDKRHYQILLAIDDSESMREMRADRMALASMTLLLRSLSTVDAGDIGVLSFGEHIKTVVPMGTPFSESNGPSIVSQFTFEQRKSEFGLLMKEAVHQLTGNSQASQTDNRSKGLQKNILFVISDGRITNHSMLTEWISEAITKNVFVVCIILDVVNASNAVTITPSPSPQPSRSPSIHPSPAQSPRPSPSPSPNPKTRKTSITTLTRFVQTKDGKSKVVKVLDEFPFPFYLIIRDFQSLPRVLGDAVRQWVEIMEEQ
ncbi:putative ribosome export associated1 [Blattamonas nauphoetae]|uniref:Ribosome export associated1 n=1 Tax=Blattamonas nauphoetae TaxID=2049346 RepID=A0ABQ9XIG6_9EUKA|nr:putative ribosome export associated1 [Blattamonas nauphoetae]